MRTFHWLGSAILYLVGAAILAVLVRNGEATNGYVGGALGMAAAALFAIPGFISWQERCWIRAQDLAQSSATAGTAAFVRELKKVDQQYAGEMQRLSMEANKWAVAAQEAQEKLLSVKLLQRDKRGRIVSLPVAQTALAVSPLKGETITIQADKEPKGLSA